MPRLERQKFIDVIDAMLIEQVIPTIRRNGTLYEALYGFDARATITNFVGLPDPTGWNSTAKATALTAPLRDHTTQIVEAFRTNRVQAAIHVAEAWYTYAAGSDLPGVLSGLEMARGAANRIELVVVHGCWPREHLSRARCAAIQRAADGSVTGAEEVSLLDVGPQVTREDSWVNTVLPLASRRW